jgi:hypothetical protein
MALSSVTMKLGSHVASVICAAAVVAAIIPAVVVGWRGRSEISSSVMAPVVMRMTVTGRLTASSYSSAASDIESKAIHCCATYLSLQFLNYLRARLRSS